MDKISIGLRGWRFEQGEVLTEDGSVRPIGTMAPDTRHRVLRLAERIDDPCDACWLVHGPEEPERCRTGVAIYGEPGAEVLVCRTHERDFLYWFREEGGAGHAGDAGMADAFHAWFADGGRAPEEYVGLEHVEEAPGEVPEPPDIQEGMPGIEEELATLDEEDLEALDVDLSDLDL